MHNSLASVPQTRSNQNPVLDFKQLFSLGDQKSTNIRTRRGPFGCEYFIPHRDKDEIPKIIKLEGERFQRDSGHVSKATDVGLLLRNQCKGSVGALATDSTMNVFLLANKKGKLPIWIGLSFINGQWEIDSDDYDHGVRFKAGSQLFIPG